MADASTPPLRLRLANNQDSPGIIDLVGHCFDEYPGCILDVNGEEADLLDPEGAFSEFWVLDRDGDVVGTIACQVKSDGDNRWLELKKLYLDPSIRGAGWARRLVIRIEDFARRHDIRFVGQRRRDGAGEETSSRSADVKRFTKPYASR